MAHSIEYIKANICPIDKVIIEKLRSGSVLTFDRHDMRFFGYTPKVSRATYRRLEDLGIVEFKGDSKHGLTELGKTIEL